MKKPYELSELKNCLGERVLTDVSMKQFTAFKSGGNADVVLFPQTIDELLFILKILKDVEIPYEIIGNGSNIIVTDGGIEGAVIILTQLKGITVKENTISALAGNLLSEVANAAMKNALTGMEFASGIPGSIGGAVYMNAGAYGGEIKDILKEVKFIDENNQLRTLTVDQLQMDYRTSIFSGNSHIIVSALFQLASSESNAIKEKMAQLNAQRRLKQPLNYPSAGSTFKRPEGYFAAKLIEDAGLKGFRIGGAMVSEKHAGFIINYENATSNDILSLIDEVQKKVYEQFSVTLIPEVRIIGKR